MSNDPFSVSFARFTPRMARTVLVGIDWQDPKIQHYMIEHSTRVLKIKKRDIRISMNLLNNSKQKSTSLNSKDFGYNTGYNHQEEKAVTAICDFLRH